MKTVVPPVVLIGVLVILGLVVFFGRGDDEKGAKAAPSPSAVAATSIPTLIPTPRPQAQISRASAPQIWPTPTSIPTPLPPPTPASLMPVPLPKNIIFHADFETPSVGSDWVTYDKGEVEEWKIGGTVDLVGTFWKAASGSQSVDLIGWGPGAISREFSTTPGQSYELCFAVSGNPTGGDPIKIMEVWWDSTLVDRISVDTTSRSPLQMGWAWRGYQVTAVQETAHLEFRGVAGGTHWGPVLDDVTVAVGSSGCKGEVKLVTLPTPTTVPMATPTPATPVPAAVPIVTSEQKDRLFRNETRNLPVVLPPKVWSETKALIRFKFEKGGSTVGKSKGLRIWIDAAAKKGVQEGETFDYSTGEQVQSFFAADADAEKACFDKVMAQVFLSESGAETWVGDQPLAQNFCVENPVKLLVPHNYDQGRSTIGAYAENKSIQVQRVTPDLACPFKHTVRFVVGPRNEEIADGASFQIAQGWTFIEARLIPESRVDLNRLGECVLRVK